MADDTRDIKPEAVDEALGEMKLEEPSSPTADSSAVNGSSTEAHAPNDIKRSLSTSPGLSKSRSQSPIKKQSASQTPKSEGDREEETLSADITVTVEPGKAPKLSRKSSQKIVSRPPTLFKEVPDVTDEATTIFQVIKDCIYGSKYMGYSEHDALDCDCSEEWSMYS
jgi:hypothetical protein